MLSSKLKSSKQNLRDVKDWSKKTNGNQSKKIILFLTISLLMYLCVYGTIAIFSDNIILRSIKDIVILFLTFYSIMYITRKKYNSYKGKKILILLIFIIILGSLGYLSNNSVLNFVYGLKVTVLPIGLLFVGLLLKEESLPSLMKTVRILFALIVSAWVIQYVLGVDKLISLGFQYGENVRHFGTGIPRLPSLVGTPSAYAMLLAILGLLLERNDFLCKKYKSIKWLVRIITFVFLIISTQRTAIIFWIVSQLSVFLFYIHGSFKNKKLLILGTTFLTSPFLVLIILNLNTKLYSTDSLVARYGHWFSHLQPLFTLEGAVGMGIGSIGAATLRVNELGYDVSDYYVDNQFFAFYQQSGFIGTILWLTLITVITIKLYNQYVLNKSYTKSEKEIISMSMIVGLIVSGLFTNVLELYPFNVFFWLFVGVSLAPLINGGKK